MIFTGYTALHFCACWGHRSCIETLIQNGANLDLRTNHGETSRQLSVRYQHIECIEFIDWASKVLLDYDAIQMQHFALQV